MPVAETAYVVVVPVISTTPTVALLISTPVASGLMPPSEKNAGPRPTKIRRPWPAKVRQPVPQPCEDSEPWMLRKPPMSRVASVIDDVEDGGGARVRELHRDRAAAHLELLVDRDVAGVHADEHLAAGGDAREGAVQLGVEDAGHSPGAAGRREHEAAGAVGQRGRSGRDGDVGEREPGHGAATVQGEVAGEAVAVDAQHGADDLDAGAAPAEGEGDAGRVGGGAEGGGVELRAAERDPAGGAGRGRGQRAGGARRR